MKLRLASMLFAAAVTLAVAQNPTPPDPAQMAQHQVQHLTNALALNTSQQQQALNIFTSAANTMSSLHANQKAAHEALEAAIKSNNASAIQQQAAILGQLETQSVQAHATAAAAFYQILTPQQQTQFSEMHKGHFGMHGHPGPDGPPPAPQP